jgi:two-component system OmpR family sensor kinase/two-component system sensor histidine kinase QseC
LLLLTPLLGLAVWWMIARALQPLKRVAVDVRSRDAGALEPVEAVNLPEEVEPLVTALNALLGRLSTFFEKQRAFVADAAHELRSPLTALKLQIQVLRRSHDEQSRSQAVASLADGVDRASRLVDQLLALARSESVGGPSTLTSAAPVPLGEIARQALADTVPYASSRNINLTLEADDKVKVAGDKAALSIMVRNLADNAVRYCPPGATVLVALTALPSGSALLTVDDSGPGIPEAERERVLDRFYRREANESGESGTGLGLAIVKNIAIQHGAQLTLGSSALGGLRVEVEFPAAAAAEKAMAA